MPGASTVASSALTRRWEWPPWCLDSKPPCIEVYVVDDDTGYGCWMAAEPQSRVVDKAGRDSYLCAEYNWDGDFYVQDFGPQHVRRRGQRQTVFEQFEHAAAAGAPTQDDLDQTMLAPGRIRGVPPNVGDRGGGVSAFLDSNR